MKYRLLGLPPRISNLASLGWPEKSHSNKFPKVLPLVLQDHTWRRSVPVACGRDFTQGPRRLGVGILGLPPNYGCLLNSQDPVSPSVNRILFALLIS